MIVQAFIAIEFWFESQMQWKYTVYAKTSAFLLVNIAKIALILLQAPLVAFAWAGLAETIFGSIGLLIVYRLRGFSITGLAVQPARWPRLCCETVGRWSFPPS